MEGMKKHYIIPAMQVVKVCSPQLLAGSVVEAPGYGSEFAGRDFETELEDELIFGFSF